MVHRIEVTPRFPYFPDIKGNSVLNELLDLGIKSVSLVRTVKVYKLEGINSKNILERIARELLSEGLWQDYAIDQPVIEPNGAKIVEVALKPGMMNTEIESILKAVNDMGIKGLKMAGSGMKYLFYGNITNEQLKKITVKVLMNPLIEEVIQKPEETLLIWGKPSKTQTIPIRNFTADQLMKLSKNKLWLNLSEMKAIQRFFQHIGRDPTDVEIETIAQTWSEHCYHKTFKSPLIINSRKKAPLFSRLQRASKKINSPQVLSLFVDNAGVVAFDDQYAIAAKVETHNSPSAIEPYGGAATGSGGVFRDVFSTGQGAKVLVSTDIFCLAPPDMPDNQVPKGCLHPRRILKQLVAGVGDYGNRMGIPTNNGSVTFHKDFRAKPTVIVGAYGILPKKYARKGVPRINDLIMVVGGRTGRDGIHGVTFASGSMTEKTEQVSASSVQIGNAIEEKRMFDALLECRDKGYIRAIHDCGGGGFSSAIGELAKDLGCEIHLERVPLKYSGLAPWEIWVSESQEREIVVIDPKHRKEVENILSHYNVEGTILGHFTGRKRLEVYYQGEIVCDLDMHFLHQGIPQLPRIGKYIRPKISEPKIPEPKNYQDILIKILSSWNVCSKEPIVRRYDHENISLSILKPFSGVFADGPNNAAVIAPLPESTKGLAVAHGINPLYNRIDPYWGAASAMDEAVRNLVAVGADPRRIALLDNFIWPTPEEEELGQLDRAIDAITKISVAWKMPFVSGKDSLSSTYRSSTGEVIKIPPVLCISAFAPIADIKIVIGSDLKSAGNLLYIIGETKAELGGSEYYHLHGQLGSSVPKVKINQAYQIFTKLHQAITKGLIASCHDCSDGGLAVTVAEMCFGGNLGAEIDLSNIPCHPSNMRSDFILFSQSNTRFIVEVEPKNEAKLLKLFGRLPVSRLGKVKAVPIFETRNGNQLLIRENVEKLKQVWKRPLRRIFH